MNLFGHMLIYMYLLFVVFRVESGQESNPESQYEVLHRHKRTAYSCTSTNALLKYQFTSGHTACMSASASLDTATAGVSVSEQTEIVNAHNSYRASTSATDMTMMSWDTEVAFVAQKWAEGCPSGHDTGYKRRIPGRFGLGQNLAWSSAKMTWTAAIKLWHDEITDFVYNSDSNVLSKVGHYTQVVWAKSIKIGCGYAKCGSQHTYVCNYGPPGNFNIKTPYTTGTKCAACSSNCQSNLCNCDLVCLNGGTLNLVTCTCSCISGYTGNDCALNCGTKSDPSTCLSFYTASKCSVYSNVPDECPNMCNMCPNAGIAITGATDGKGVVPFDLTGAGGTSTSTIAAPGSTDDETTEMDITSSTGISLTKATAVTTPFKGSTTSDDATTERQHGYSSMSYKTTRVGYRTTYTFVTMEAENGTSPSVTMGAENETTETMYSGPGIITSETSVRGSSQNIFACIYILLSVVTLSLTFNTSV